MLACDCCVCQGSVHPRSSVLAWSPQIVVLVVTDVKVQVASCNVQKVQPTTEYSIYYLLHGFAAMEFLLQRASFEDSAKMNKRALAASKSELPSL
eukprot:6203180-Pleurochrysis_carterae.AAC.5